VSDELKEQLIQKERQLNIFMALDKLRDAIHTQESPRAFYEQILRLLMTHFTASNGVMMILPEHAGKHRGIAHA
jgi:hypothetical protein